MPVVCSILSTFAESCCIHIVTVRNNYLMRITALCSITKSYGGLHVYLPYPIFILQLQQQAIREEEMNAHGDQYTPQFQILLYIWNVTDRMTMLS